MTLYNLTLYNLTLYSLYTLLYEYRLLWAVINPQFVYKRWVVGLKRIPAYDSLNLVELHAHSLSQTNKYCNRSRDTLCLLLLLRVTLRLASAILFSSPICCNAVWNFFQLVPKDYKIHRHCFLGSWSEAEAWLQKFPCSYIGLTPAVTHSKPHSVLRDLMWHLPLDKILLETDAPYFIPAQVGLDSHSMCSRGEPRSSNWCVIV